MTHLSPGGGAMPPATFSPPSARPALPHPFSGSALLSLQIASRQARLAECEAEMIAACEAAALSTRAPTNAAAGRERWNRATWHRYLAAAMRLKRATARACAVSASKSASSNG